MYFSKYAKWGDYHWGLYMKNTKYTRHANKIREWIKEKPVLDIGAGDGLITFLIGGKGIDNEPEGVRLAKKRGVDVIVGSAYEIPYKDEQFTSALMADVLEHLEDPKKALQEARRVIREYLYITTPPKRDDGKLTDKFHYFELTPEELKTLVESQGFELVGDIEVNRPEKVMYGRFRKNK